MSEDSPFFPVGTDEYGPYHTRRADEAAGEAVYVRTKRRYALLCPRTGCGSPMLYHHPGTDLWWCRGCSHDLVASDPGELPLGVAWVGGRLRRSDRLERARRLAQDAAQPPPTSLRVYALVVAATAAALAALVFLALVWVS